MPPKGRGRGRGSKQEEHQQPGRPGGHPQQPRGRSGPPGFEEQGLPPRGHASPPEMAPLAGKKPSQPKQETKKTDADPVETLGFEFKQKLAIDTSLPRKPSPGKLGRKIRLVSNCYEVQLPTGNVYHYDVEICNKRRQSATTGEAGDKKYRCINTKRNREVIRYMLQANSNFLNIHLAYDGRKNLYSKNGLKFVKGEYKCEVKVPEDNPDPNNPERTDDFEVVIKPVKKKGTNDCLINLDIVHALYSGHVVDISQDAIMALETILRHGAALKYIPVGRSFFYPPDPSDLHPLGGGREIWFGYHQSIRLGQWKPMINLDVTATTFYEKGPVLKYVCDILHKDRRAFEQTGGLRDSDLKLLNKELKNLRIETTHDTYRRKYRILRITRESANTLKFTRTDQGQQVSTSVADYFRVVKNYPLRYPNLPCIQGNPESKRIYLPLEVCDVVAGQHCKKKLEERQNAEMIKFTATQPKKRFEEITSIRRGTGFENDAVLREFGLKVAREPLQLDGRVLEAPNVLYKKNDNMSKVLPRDGSWDMRGNEYYRGSSIERWVLLNLSPRFCQKQSLDKFAHLLVSIASEQGIHINRPESIESVNVDHRNPVKSVLQNIRKKYQADLVVIVVPGRDKTIYGDLKQAAETSLGMITQCIKDDNVVKKCNPPLVSNLCQKINAKTGGVNNALTPGETPSIMRKPVIIFGADVTHPGPASSRPSIAAVVGSLDAHPSRYAVSIRAQTNRDRELRPIEIILDLKDMVVELLKAFHRNTRGKKPEKIIFYRDGVSEGQFDHVRDHELKCIREACRQLEASYQPGITFVVVQKRHHTRFVPRDFRDGVGKMRNIPPGTTVDNTVVHPLNFDFFLCSHFGLQGTSRPAHYTVLEDDNGFTADDLHKLTYYLCHIYARCTKSISIPAPVQYAHLAAYRAMCHLGAVIDDSSSSDTGSRAEFRPLPENVHNAIKVLEALLNTMYFV